jgi:lipoate-protein ligase A
VEALSCRLLPWEIADGPTNMAADEVMVRTAAERGIASLRFYAWSPATLSLGYFQPATARLSDPRLAALPFVRRPSGGGAIVHHHEVTYALAVPPDKKWHAGGPWMLRMHQLIARALDIFQFGLHYADESVQNGPVLCFQHFTAGDLLFAGHKVVGSAQRKYCRALLQHGSILLSASEHTPALSGIRDLWSGLLQSDHVRRGIASTFRTETRWALVSADWTDEERVGIPALVREKYGTATWNERR